MKESFSGVLQKLDPSFGGGHYVSIPEEIQRYYHQQKITRFCCMLNGEQQIYCAFLPLGNSNYYILINQSLKKKLYLELGEELHIELEPDTSKYGMPLPIEMEELLRQDPEGDLYFHQLTLGKQRSLLYMIGKPKSSEIRLRKAILVIEYLKTSGGKLIQGDLMQFMKMNR